MHPFNATLPFRPEQVSAHIEAIGIEWKVVKGAFFSLIVESKYDVPAEHNNARQDNNIEVLPTLFNMQKIANALLNHSRVGLTLS